MSFATNPPWTSPTSHHGTLTVTDQDEFHVGTGGKSTIHVANQVSRANGGTSRKVRVRWSVILIRACSLPQVRDESCSPA